MTRREFDPLGKDALFLPPQSAPSGRPRGKGREALFSGPQRREGDVAVECGSCRARTPVPKLALPVRLLPSAFVPFRRHPHLMRCPACRRPAWCRIDWRG